MTVMDRLLSLIENTFKVDFKIGCDTPLISTGLIDSLHFAQFLLVLEKEYGKVITTRDVGTDNFDTPRQIEKYLQKI